MPNGKWRRAAGEIQPPFLLGSYCLVLNERPWATRNCSEPCLPKDLNQRASVRRSILALIGIFTPAPAFTVAARRVCVAIGRPRNRIGAPYCASPTPPAR